MRETRNERYFRCTGIDREAQEKWEDEMAEKKKKKRKKQIIINELTGF